MKTAPERESELDVANFYCVFAVRSRSPICPETLFANFCDVRDLALPDAARNSPEDPDDDDL